jgi:hypothetical protein
MPFFDTRGIIYSEAFILRCDRKTEINRMRIWQSDGRGELSLELDP